MLEIVDRKTKERVEEKIYGEKLLLFTYGKLGGFLRYMARFSFSSYLVGLWMKMPFTKRKVAPFVAKYKIDPSEWEKENFNSFNDFFIRKLKKGVRPIADSPVVAPADGRYVAYASFAGAKEILVKGETFLLHELLQDDDLTEKYKEATLVIARLAPPDYHRFHAPVSGRIKSIKNIPGPLFSVNPKALRGRLKRLVHNKRVLMTIETEDFGDVLFIPIGATCVGTIHWSVEKDNFINKGDELGYFSFGGSMIILLFEKGRVEISSDVLGNSREVLETYIRFGESLSCLPTESFV
ncbi:MAG: phosphatidylserine decarboxylase [Verrucomicrobia bacterium]|nr:phosphatidylserine decarboxylase [Verrucomicrobiota bacterium]